MGFLKELKKAGREGIERGKRERAEEIKREKEAERKRLETLIRLQEERERNKR